MSLYMKIAKARWQKEVPETTPEATRAIRDRLQAFESTRTPEQALRQDTLDKKFVERYFRLGFGVRKELPNGPANVGGLVLMNPDHTRKLVDRVHDAIAERTGQRPPPVPDSALASIAKAVLDHERAEGVQLGNVFTGAHPSASHASHAGTLPILAERVATQNPDAHAFMQQMRTLNPEDRYIQKVLRNRGQAGNFTPPMGGAAHRSAEAEARKIVPRLLPLQIQRALGADRNTYDATQFLAHNSALPSGGRWERLAKKTKGLVTGPRMLGAATALSIAAPALYGYLRGHKEEYADARPDDAQWVSKTADVRVPYSQVRAGALGVYGGALAGSVLGQVALTEEMNRRGILREPLNSAHVWGPALGTAAATYAGLSYAYPRMPRHLKALASFGAGSLGGAFGQAHHATAIAGALRRESHQRLQQAREEGSEFKNYLPTGTTTWGKIVDHGQGIPHTNELLRSVAQNEPVGVLNQIRLRQLDTPLPTPS